MKCAVQIKFIIIIIIVIIIIFHNPNICLFAREKSDVQASRGLAYEHPHNPSIVYRNYTTDTKIEYDCILGNMRYISSCVQTRQEPGTDESQRNFFQF